MSKYRAVTIWCARFAVNFGTAPLMNDSVAVNESLNVFRKSWNYYLLKTRFFTFPLHQRHHDCIFNTRLCFRQT